ncbi:carboxylesterase/lipase family protein [Williamsia deligens]|uniref:Carboxylic ester hydrolase n=1 Tax=Williamsia deligens TaxID=321325 RepID=A0ABW3GBC1_9NOCA|nr:carboxylesterase family protein [Williamsia deligens]MCP2196030.1 para-nitrobenzyl esterase [Williamsia deligens]
MTIISMRRAWIVMSAAALMVLGLGVCPPAADAAPGAIRVAGGSVSGFERDGVTTYLGVPFASTARFAPPGPARPWSGVRSATQHGPQCPQALPTPGFSIPSSVPIPSPTSEDCLSVDLYVPHNAAGRDLPVMVYLYGGAFVLGSNAQYDAPAEIARSGDVIVAVPNYRVGPFGFLALPELAAQNGGVSGTLGIADQQAALRWVRDDIGAFGGNPRDVTIFGESAGGMSVCLQLAAPGSRGLFRRAIVESGGCARSPLVPPSQAEGVRRSEAYAAQVGCRDPRTRLSCLRRLPIDRLLDSPTTRFDGAAVTWTPFLDGTVLTQTPEDALRGGAARGMPLIVGSNANEGALFVLLFDYVSRQRLVTEASYRRTVEELYPGRAGRILAAYPSSRYGSPARALTAVYTDSLFACPAQTTVAAATQGGARVFQYRFTVAPVGDNPVLPGAFHAAEIPYLFNRLGGVPIPWTGASAAFAAQIKRQWSTFARTGSPNGPALPRWAPWSSSDQRYLSMAIPGSTMREGFSSLHACRLWSD